MRLAVLAVLAAGGAAFGGYYLWPSGRHIASCTLKHAPVPAAAQRVLAGYAHRIRYTVERSEPGSRSESWSDPDTGRSRQVSYSRGAVDTEFGVEPEGRTLRTLMVMYDARIWIAHSQPAFPRGSTNETVALAQALRDEVANGKARVVGRGAARTLHLLEIIRLPAPHVPTVASLPKALRQPRVLHVDTWVDALTYLPVRTRTNDGFTSSVSDTTWLPRTPENVARTRVVIPRGFTQVTQRGNGFTEYTHSISLHCNHS